MDAFYEDLLGPISAEIEAQIDSEDETDQKSSCSSKDEPCKECQRLEKLCPKCRKKARLQKLKGLRKSPLELFVSRDRGSDCVASADSPEAKRTDDGPEPPKTSPRGSTAARNYEEARTTVSVASEQKWQSQRPGMQRPICTANEALEVERHYFDAQGRPYTRWESCKVNQVRRTDRYPMGGPDAIAHFHIDQRHRFDTLRRYGNASLGRGVYFAGPAAQATWTSSGRDLVSCLTRVKSSC